ncbi:MAG: hypothetical protein KGH59_02320 [Candidatus Micrarchaeota archaeon]|nr:hypothetical protein [Candidatus Micrarchaeota archaeon]MDE1804594.1 hypothetical protein [Candidatus Micrarchaeota archaeon]MDE1846493.1 hypothetical protein [Candidatus Micrarchaeota archaeon]
MKKSVLVYVGILVVIGIFAYFTYNPAKGIVTTTSIPSKATTSVPTTTTPVSSASTTIVLSTTTVPFSSCLSSSPTVKIFNGNFSTGTYEGWNQTGGGFGLAPLNSTQANQNGGYFNHTWIGYNGTFFASTFHGGLGVQPGNLTSNTFLVTEPFLNFKIISPQNGALYVEILANGVPKVVTHFNTYTQSNLYPFSQFLNGSMPMSTVLCQNVSIRVVADVVGSYTTSKQYIAIGDFVQGRSPYPNYGQIIVNQSIS